LHVSRKDVLIFKVTAVMELL